MSQPPAEYPHGQPTGPLEFNEHRDGARKVEEPPTESENEMLKQLKEVGVL
jgi:hypothetical protein